MFKVCSQCRTSKPITDFYRLNRAPDGLAYVCKLCSSESGKAWYKKNTQLTKDRAKQYAEENREKVIEFKRVWRKANPDKQKASEKNYRRENSDKVKTFARALPAKYARVVFGNKVQRPDGTYRFDQAKPILTFEQYIEMMTNPCYLCGGDLSETGRSLDRLNNERGYEFENVKSCCSTCNTIKNKFSLEFLAKHLPKIISTISNLNSEGKKDYE